MLSMAQSKIKTRINAGNRGYAPNVLLDIDKLVTRPCSLMDSDSEQNVVNRLPFVLTCTY